MNAFCRRGLRLIIASAILIAGVATVSAQQVFSPPRGSPERAAILDAVRPAAEVVLNPPVEFVVTKMNVVDDWAFVALNPRVMGSAARLWRSRRDGAVPEGAPGQRVAGAPALPVWRSTSQISSPPSSRRTLTAICDPSDAAL